MTYPIEKGIPPPKPRVRYGVWASTLRKLGVGDSFLVPSEEVNKNVRASIGYASRSIGIKITTRMTNKGLRTWRLS
jgi:hypothetical protein